MVALAILSVAVGLVAGLFLGGRLANLLRRRVRWWPVGVAGVLVLGLGNTIDSLNTYEGLLVGYGLLIVFSVRNLHLAGSGVMTIGLVAICVPIVLNEGVPVRGDALVSVGIVEADGLDNVTFVGPRHLETDDDTLGWLGDVIPVPAVDEIVSFGHIIALVGLADLVANLLRGRRRRWDGPYDDDQADYLIIDLERREQARTASVLESDSFETSTDSSLDPL